MFRRAALAATSLLSLAQAQQHLTLTTEDGAQIQADLYGTTNRGIVLAHGGRFQKESWSKQAKALESAGFRSIAIDFRGEGNSHGPGESDMYTAPLYADVIAAVHYLQKTGAKTISLIGASFGGDAVAAAIPRTRPNEIDRIILMGTAPDTRPEKLTLPKLFIVAREDSNGAGPRLPGIRAYYEKTPEPKELLILEGNAHAQFLFDTDQGDRVMREILRFLNAQ